MSGGHFNYCQHQITNGLSDFSNDAEVIRRFPKLADRLEDLSRDLQKILHDIDWDLSDDSYLSDDAEFERESLKLLGGGQDA